MAEPETYWQVRIVCTGNKSHKKTRLATVRRGRNHEGEIYEGIAVENTWLENDPEAVPGTGQSRHSYVFDCPRCGRHMLVESGRLWSVLPQIVESAGNEDVDLSLLGF